MFEKVNPSHPDKVADRIAGAIVDIAYRDNFEPKIAVEVLLGHGICTCIIETTAWLNLDDIKKAIKRISGVSNPFIRISKQNKHLAKNQVEEIRCGDNGIFKGTPITAEQKSLTEIAKDIYSRYASDGKYLIDDEKLIICQSNVNTNEIEQRYPGAIINPLGDWTGGTDVDSGATNRKLGSDMGDSVTGGGLHGKDLSKADVSVNIYAFLKAQELNEPVEFSCAIGDETIDGRPYREIVDIAKKYIDDIGGFEKFAEWGLIR